MIWNIISSCLPDPSSFGLSPIYLLPLPKIIRICSGPFCAWRLCRTQMLPSRGEAFRIHGSTTRQVSFAVGANVLLTNLIQGGERMQIPLWIFGSLFPAGQITYQEEATAFHLVFPNQSFCNIVLVDQYCKLYLFQEVGHLAFTNQQCAGNASPYPYLSKNIVVRSVYSLYFYNVFCWFFCTYGIYCLFYIEIIYYR